MQYLLLVYTDPELMAALPPAEYDRLMHGCITHADELREGGCLLGSQQLEASTQARTVRVREGAARVTDGPFAETREQFVARSAASRAQAYRGTGIQAQAAIRDVAGMPLGLTRSVPFEAQMRAETKTKEGKEFYRVEGYASVFARGYEMWDFFGPYTEYVDEGAADETFRGVGRRE